MYLSRLLFAPPRLLPAVLPCRRFATKVKITNRISDEYLVNDPPPKPRDLDQEEQRRKQMLKYVFYNPTPLQRLQILKARFLATGWMYFLTAVLSYAAVKFINWLYKFSNRKQYCIQD